MLKIKNKFIIFVIVIFIGLISFYTIYSIFNNKINTSSYVLLLKGQALLNSNSLNLNNKEELKIGDTVETIGESSLAVLEWGDGSITRLGGNSSIQVKQLYISDNLSQINIGFELLSGKSWSNIISFFGENSYFKEYFRDSEAAARGTVFNIDLNNNYLHVTDHEVTLTSSGKIQIIGEDKPFDIKTFTFIDLEEFLRNLKDQAWETLNIQIDKEYIESLKVKLRSNYQSFQKWKEVNIESILNDEQKRQEYYNGLLESYQKLNFVKSDDSQLFNTKIELKQKLIELSNQQDKQALIQNTLYDFKDSISNGNYGDLTKIINILSENNQLIKNIDINNYINLDAIPDKIKQELKNNLEGIKNIFGTTIVNGIDLTIDLNDLKDLKNKGENFINDTLDNSLEQINNLIKK